MRFRGNFVMKLGVAGMIYEGNTVKDIQLCYIGGGSCGWT